MKETLFNAKSQCHWIVSMMESNVFGQGQPSGLAVLCSQEVVLCCKEVVLLGSLCMGWSELSLNVKARHFPP